ncbi:glycosyltransferase [Singulisphaera sp. GP187]|uniref:glycosyltransferase n=1 Tax=Singulisphaera sp. GP187 TaxID=1882752 RepID=UPI0020B16131|nr:glycosyltransferase [Singulisphaera sp. GP187]
MTDSRPRDGLDVTRNRLALAVADVNWFSTENLFREVEREGVTTLLLNCRDYRNAWKHGLRPWSWNTPLVESRPNLWEHELVLPTGWMKRFPTLGMRPIRRTIQHWHQRHAPDARLALVMSYPYYLHLSASLRPDFQIYYNIDDYSLYWPAYADQIKMLERKAALESDLTICVSRVRAEELRAAVPEAAAKIRHLPHGAPTTSLTEHPWELPAPPPADIASLPRPLLGFVGSVEDRLDWKLLIRLSEALPEASIVLVGQTNVQKSDSWHADYQQCLARPNVHAVGWRPQNEINLYNRAFDVCMIPYLTDHPFNIACCPTKILDYMVTGRPIVSTALPECQLYPHLLEVAADSDAFIAAVRAILEAHSNDGRAALRYDWARTNTCRHVVDRLIDLIPV